MIDFFKRQIEHANRLITKLGFTNAVVLRFGEVFRFETVVLKIGGVAIRVRPKTPDYRAALECLEGEYNPLVKEMDSDFDGLIIDGGGHIGSAAISLARLFPNARVVTIEPSSGNFKVLERNISNHPNVVGVHAALAAKSGGSVELTDHGKGNWGFSIVKDWKNVEKCDVVEVVDTLSIEDIRASHSNRKIGLLKLDIEGAEKDIFDNAAHQLEDIPIVFVELHERFVPGCEAAFNTFAQARDTRSFDGKEKKLSLLRRGGMAAS